MNLTRLSSWPIDMRTSLILIAALYAFAGGILTLVGWFADIPRLTDWGGNGISMFVNTAICAVLSGFILLGYFFHGRSVDFAVRTLGFIVMLIGGLTLLEHVTAFDLGIDTFLLSRSWGQVAAVAPMRMGPPASVAFALVGIAGILGTFRDTLLRRLASFMAVAVIAISLLSLIGYWYEVEILYTLPHFTGIAQQTASILFGLGVGLVASIPDQGTALMLRRKDAGGALARVFLLPILMTPIGVGGILLWGQNAGLYDSSFGMAIFALATIFFMFTLMTWTARRLGRTDEIRRRQEVSLRESREQLTGMLDSLNDPFATLDAHWRFTFINDPGLARLEMRRDQILGKNVWELIPIAKETEAYRQLHHAMDDRVAVRYEVYYERLRRWFSESAAPIPGGGLAVYSVEITDRKGAELSLSRNEQNQRLLAEIGMLAATTGVRGGISQNELFDTICQRVAASLQVARCGLSRVDLENQAMIVEHDAHGDLPSLKGLRDVADSCSILISEGTAGRTFVINDLAADSRTSQLYDEKYRLHGIRAMVNVPLYRGGKWVASFWVGQAHSRRWSTEDVNHIKGVADRLWLVAEQTRIASALMASEERYRSLVSVITDVPWVTDATGRFAHPQLNWEAYTGQSWDEHQGFGWLDGIHPDDRDLIRQTWLDSVHQQTLYESRGRLWHAASGGWRHFVARAVPLSNPDGSIREWVGTYTDVSEQYRAEEALRDADRRKDEFLATLAHELRNPLAPIRNAIEISRLAVPAESRIQRAQEVIDRQIRHMTRLIDDLLDVSRISQDRLELCMEIVDIKESIDLAVEATRPLIDENAHRLDIVLPPEPVYVNADVARLAQVISNLLNNASKYTEKGGHILLVVEQQTTNILIRIIDNGIGIPPERLPRIFELFSQVENAISRSRGGLGIGLSLVKRLVEMHGGDVEATSQGLQSGSEFRVRLPNAVKSRETVVKTPDRVGLYGGGGSRILVVDDNRDAASSLSDLLRMMGHEVQTSEDGNDACKLVAEFRPTVAILDLGLPGKNGYEIAQFIRDQAWGRNMLLVALTGWGQDEDKERTEKAGFDHHFVKPADPNRLLRLLVEHRSN